ncbi:hypothetical protein J2X06_000842 [Lysobacter niastensis]|uniref:NAD/FAD-utilizing enzyme n=1 Tax=Lysobacter niastensis TaxID=380629 RepID=A0ABU1W7T9_9GAMM|nr:hypothetical protein [Lysobacter niastensis]MDR7133658.1 hypothetical protein [Lysobacter niastensis]
MAEHVITGEVSNSKVAAVLGNEVEAQRVADHLRRSLDLPRSQVQLITSRDPRVGRKLEPESHGIFLTMLRAHLWLGLAGAVVGALAFALLFSMGIPFIVNSAVMAAGVLVFFGATAGLFLGGLVTLRPDHDPYILKIRGALEEGKCAVVVHALSHEQMKIAADLLQRSGGEVVRTL